MKDEGGPLVGVFASAACMRPEQRFLPETIGRNEWESLVFTGFSPWYRCQRRLCGNKHCPTPFGRVLELTAPR